jgi:hypothetical protein
MTLAVEETYLNLISAIYDKPIVNITLKGEKTENISFEVRNETRVFTVTTLIQHSAWIFS